MAEAAPEQAAEPAAADGSGDAAWEGEDTATSQKPSGEAATPAPDTKGEETRSIEVIADLIKAQRDPVRACYDKARKDLPTLQGDMVIHFVLNPEGKIKEINLNVERSTLKSPAVVDCAIKVIKGIKFPASSRGMDTTVNYPYNLNPR
jgi:outer membrane biosynthesis protein TonB